MEEVPVGVGSMLDDAKQLPIFVTEQAVINRIIYSIPLYVSGFQLYGSTEEHDPTGANDW